MCTNAMNPDEEGARSSRLKSLYELLTGVTDADALRRSHRPREAPEVLDQPIPYLVIAARHQHISNWRRAHGTANCR